MGFKSSMKHCIELVSGGEWVSEKGVDKRKREDGWGLGKGERRKNNNNNNTGITYALFLCTSADSERGEPPHTVM